jgi:DNA-binding response OmpR family regulator
LETKRTDISTHDSMTVEIRRRILIVDNDDQESSALCDFLKQAGFEAWATWSGVHALEHLELNHFDILLVDDYVADVYVGEFIRAVCSLPSHPSVVVMQTWQARTDIRWGRSLGACSFVDKHQPKQILEAIGTFSSGS